MRLAGPMWSGSHSWAGGLRSVRVRFPWQVWERGDSFRSATWARPPRGPPFCGSRYRNELYHHSDTKGGFLPTPNMCRFSTPILWFSDTNWISSNSVQSWHYLSGVRASSYTFQGSLPQDCPPFRYQSQLLGHPHFRRANYRFGISMNCIYLSTRKANPKGDGFIAERLLTSFLPTPALLF